MKFTPEDFKGLPLVDCTQEQYCHLADKANAKLDEYRKTWVKVYGNDNGTSEHWAKQEWPGHTHQAYLVDIEPIEKKECEHRPIPLDENAPYCRQKWECMECGKKLKAKWEAVDE